MAMDRTEEYPEHYKIKRSFNPKDKMCVYAIRNMVNEKHYIGITSISLKFRVVGHFTKLRRNNHDNVYLQRAYHKYGEESFEVVSLYNDASSLDSLKEMEAIYCEIYNSHDKNFGYNLGAVGVLKKMSKLSKEKMSLSQQKRWKDESLRKSYRDRMTGSVGVKHTEETKLKISEKIKERIKSGYPYANNFKNTTPEAFERGRLKMIGKFSGNRNPASQPIIAYNPLTCKEHLFSTVVECANYFNISKSTIERRIRKQYKNSYYSAHKFLGLKFKRL